MKADAIREIERLTNEAKPVIHAPDFPTTGRYYVRVGDEWRTEYAYRQPHDQELGSTDDLARHAAHRLKQAHDHEPYAAYISENEIVVRYVHPGLPDNSPGFDNVPLNQHPVFSELENLIAGREFTQKQLIRWLRATMNGHVPESTIQHFRNLTFSNEGELAATMAASGREHVSRKIVQRVAADAGRDVIDEFTVTTPVYDLRELRGDESAYQTVTILVDVSADQDGAVIFTLTAVLDSVRAAIEATLETLRANLEDRLQVHEVGVPIFMMQ